MEKLDKKVRQLEIELLGEKFRNALLMDKLNITTEDSKAYAEKCLSEMPESEKNTDMYWYLYGTVKGKQIEQEFLNNVGSNENAEGTIEAYDNFFLPTNNLEESISFYKKLGLVEKFNFPQKGMVAFSVGDEEPAIILKDVTIHKECESTIWFVVEDVMKEYAKLKSKGINFLSKPFPIGTGLSVEFEDNFGNRLGLTDYSKK
jgi:predicted enzyme related to lactoylglutathione lyase